MFLQKTGYRALHLAALKGSQPVVQVLLLRGALVDARAKVSQGCGVTPRVFGRPEFKDTGTQFMSW
jgi:hypothetical protein